MDGVFEVLAHDFGEDSCCCPDPYPGHEGQDLGERVGIDHHEDLGLDSAYDGSSIQQGARRPVLLSILSWDTGRMSRTANLDLYAISRAAERHGVAELELFGSAVSGNFAIDSDVDLLVKRAIRNPYFWESALIHAESVYVAQV